MHVQRLNGVADKAQPHAFAPNVLRLPSKTAKWKEDISGSRTAIKTIPSAKRS